MLESLKQEVFEANLLLKKYNLVLFTWGNVSALDKKTGLFVIKPSGVSYDEMKPEDMVVLDLAGKVVEGKLHPSSDTPTHLEIYRSFPEARGVTHTHSKWATVWAQACRGIPALGTTHADYFYGEVPCTRALTQGEIDEAYERNTGRVIVEAFREIDPAAMHAVLVASHGPFTWGKSARDSVETAVVLEEIAEIAYGSLTLKTDLASMPQALLDKHYLRKHGKDAYYGQK
jgi:L-ribulose-5-phosphate 4-epimerase